MAEPNARTVIALMRSAEAPTADLAREIASLRAGLDHIPRVLGQFVQLRPFEQLAEYQSVLASLGKLERRLKGLLVVKEDLQRDQAKGAVAPELTKFVEAAAATIRKSLVNPKTLSVSPTIDAGTKLPGYKIRLQVPASELEGHVSAWNHGLFISRTPTGEIVSSSKYAKTVHATPRALAKAFLDALGTWPGVKGQAEAATGRAATAQAVVHALIAENLAQDRPTISKGNNQVQTSHRTDLPKEGDHGIDSWTYEEMVKNTMVEVRRNVKHALAHIPADAIKDVAYQLEEKGWVSIVVTLV